MVTAGDYDEGVELAELSLNDNRHGDIGGEGHREGEIEREGDQAPLLANDDDVRAKRRARRTWKREAESTMLRRRLRLLWKALCGLLCLGTAVSAAVTLVAAIELRRHLGRSFFALPLSVHLLLDALLALTPLLAASGDGEGEPPPPVPTNQVEFQRQLRAGRTIAQARRSPQDDDETCCGGAACCFLLGMSRGTSAVVALVYSLLDAAWCCAFAVAVLAVAWATAVEADGTVAPEWRGMHTALTAAAVLSAVAAGIRVLAAFAIAAYLRARSRLVYVLRRTDEPPWHYTMSPRMQRVAIRQATLLFAGACLQVAIGMGSYIFHFKVDTESADHYEHCDPLDTTLCALPFPSSFFLEKGVEASSSSATGTGYRVSFGPKSLPYTRGRLNISPISVNAFDGFSTLGPILFYIEGLSASGFAGPGDIGASLHANSTTWLIDADTGRMVPHFVELDALDPKSPLAVLQPAAPLRHGTRYIVAVCGALGDWGELLPPTPGFRELVEASQADRMTKVRPDLRLRADRFSKEVFPALRNIGLGLGSGPSGSSRALSNGDGGGDGDRSISSAFRHSSEDDGGGGNGVRARESGPSIGRRATRRRRQLANQDHYPSSGAANSAAAVGAATVVSEEGWSDGEGLVGEGLGDVQLAWDFVTASEESQLGALRSMRETSKAWLEVALSAGQATSSSVPPRRLGDLGAVHSAGAEEVVGDIDFGKDRNGIPLKMGRGRGSETSGWTRRDGRRRTTSDETQMAPLYRVVSVQESAEYNNNNNNNNNNGDSGAESGGAPAGNDSGSSADQHPTIARTVWGRMRAPAFVSTSARGTGLLIGEGEPTADNVNSDDRKSGGGVQATLEVGFVVRVPRCVALGQKRPSALVQFGHGLFGDRAEVEDGFLDEMAERGSWVLVAADWRGMSRVDLVVVASALVSQPERLLSGTPEDLMQGFVNQEAVLTLVSRRLGDFLGDLAIGLSKEEAQALPVAFYGISQGAILGAGYTAFSSMIRRSVLGSGGTPFSLLMPRSVDFAAYHELLKLNVPSARDVRLLLSLLQVSWDRLEAAAWLAAPAPGGNNDGSGNGNGNGNDEESIGRKKAVLMQAGTGDAEVSIIGTEILARAFQATAVSPVAVPAWGVPAAAAAADSTSSSTCENDDAFSASLALYDYRREAAEVPEDDTPPPWGWVHMCVRHDPDAKQQVLEFVETGCVVNFCDGTCERPYCRRA